MVARLAGRIGGEVDLTMPDRGPIFVAGLERSGTSLMFALLASHPDIAMTRRTNLWTHFFEQYGDLSETANLDRCLSMMARYKRLVVLQPDFVELRRAFLEGERTYARLFALLEGQYADRLGRARWGDKSLNTERYARPILDAYPHARFLHMIRDPRDRYASSKTRWGVRRGGVGAGTAEWLTSVRTALEHQRRDPRRYRAVRYEDLASDPEGTLRDLCAFIGEPFAPQMLAMQGAPRLLEKGSNSSYGSREPGAITTDSIGRFRDVLTPRQVAFMDRNAAQEMSTFGYDRAFGRLEFPDRVRFLGSLPLESGRLLAWRVRERVRDRRGRPVPSYRIVEETATR
jgi:Sulfotransferase family